MTSSNYRTQIVKKNIAGSLIIKGISIIISLMLVPMTLDYVSSELYGIWLTLSSVIVWLNFFDIGFTLGLKNKLAEALALRDTQRGRHLVSTTYAIMIAIFVPLALIIWGIIPVVDWCSFLNVSSVFADEIRNALYVISACFCLQMILNVLTAVISAYQKTALSSSFPVIGNIFALVAIVLLTKTKLVSLTYLALAISAMPILVIVLATLFLFRTLFKEVSPALQYVSRKYVKDLFNLGAKFFLIQIQVVVLFQTTNILISNLSGPNDVTSYNIAYKYIYVALMIYNIILTPLWPAFTDAYTKKDFSWMRKVYNKMLLLWFMSAVCIALMVVASPFVYELWIGNKAQISLSMTIAVAVYVIINSLDSLQVFLINGTGCIRLQTYVTLAGLILHIPLSFFIGQYIGCYGVLASLILITAFYATIFTIQINRIINNNAEGIWCK